MTAQLFAVKTLRSGYLAGHNTVLTVAGLIATLLPRSQSSRPGTNSRATHRVKKNLIVIVEKRTVFDFEKKDIFLRKSRVGCFEVLGNCGDQAGHSTHIVR